jgi:hypothetical protein
LREKDRRGSSENKQEHQDAPERLLTSTPASQQKHAGYGNDDNRTDLKNDSHCSLT